MCSSRRTQQWLSKSLRLLTSTGRVITLVGLTFQVGLPTPMAHENILELQLPVFRPRCTAVGHRSSLSSSSLEVDHPTCLQCLTGTGVQKLVDVERIGGAAQGSSRIPGTQTTTPGLDFHAGRRLQDVHGLCHEPSLLRLYAYWTRAAETRIPWRITSFQLCRRALMPRATSA